MSKAITTPPVTLAEMNSAFSKAVFPPPPLHQLIQEGKVVLKQEIEDFLDREGYVPNQQ